jgi:hypothetical protein
MTLLDLKGKDEKFLRGTNQSSFTKLNDRNPISKAYLNQKGRVHDLNCSPYLLRTAPHPTTHLLQQSQKASPVSKDSLLVGTHFTSHFANSSLMAKYFPGNLFGRHEWSLPNMNAIYEKAHTRSHRDSIRLCCLLTPGAECQLRAINRACSLRFVPAVTNVCPTPAEDFMKATTNIVNEPLPLIDGNIPINPLKQPLGLKKSVSRQVNSFPEILHRLLFDLEFIQGGSDIAQFLPTSSGFIILDFTRFETEIMKIYFPRMSTFASFQRQLNLYSFHRIHNSASRGVYYHPGFSRNLPLLCIRKRLKRL